MKLTTKNYYANRYINSAEKLGISHQVLHPYGLVRLYTKSEEFHFFRAVPQINSALSSDLCKNKNLTIDLLREKKIPTPAQHVINNFAELEKIIKKIPVPSVIKPINGIGGKDVFVNINTRNNILNIARDLLKKHSKIIVESYENGEDYRFLVLDNKVIGIVNRTAPTITGDGKASILSLIKKLPSSNRIPLDNSLMSTLEINGYSPDDILEKSKNITVRSNANYSTGGITKTLKNSDVHPELIRLAIKSAQSVFTRLAGVDLLIKSHKKGPENNAVVIEINHNPGNIMHYKPDSGEPQDVATIILKRIFKL